MSGTNVVWECIWEGASTPRLKQGKWQGKETEERENRMPKFGWKYEESIKGSGVRKREKERNMLCITFDYSLMQLNAIVLTKDSMVNG